MAIRDVLLPLLRRRFPERSFIEGHPPDPIATFPAVHVDVGDVAIVACVATAHRDPRIGTAARDIALWKALV